MELFFCIDDLYELYKIENTRINKEFDDAYYEFCVSLYDGNYNESVSEPLGASIKKFFANLITSIRNFINKFKSYTTSTAREASYRNTLNNLEKSIRNAKEEGKTKVTMPDYDFIRDEYSKMCKDLRKYAKDFIKMKYTSTVDIDNDLRSFSKSVEYWDSRMAKAIEKKKTMSIDSALRFVEDEKRGYTHTFDSLNDCIKDIDEIRHVAEETSKRVSTLGSDILPKHVNCLRRVANSISSKVTKFAAKTIMVNVLLFA